MSFLKKLSKLNPAGHGVAARATEAAEYFGASFLAGYAQNKYRDKASVAGVPVDLAAGGALKLLGLGVDLLGGGKWNRGWRATVHSQAHILGNVGLAAFGHTLGAGLGASQSGVTRVLVEKKDVAKVKAAIPGAVVIGEIPKAPPGDYLSASQLAEMARH